ncbi:hypothetical protein [Mesobacillus subterraneus]|uniref:Uncharacterized protein n=1 Tax=Mesobacillus subterraneus TaxID=285983 RepID=A0A427TM88_9BACI|nr:hypothetical protein [Mesobacillus subterraneus]RSD25465.1 hypothetical protein EJA10_16800 [Mesobacillus subterraneus]
MNVIELLSSILSWSAIIFAARWVYRSQNLKPNVWKMTVVVILGLFSFSINLPYMDQQVKLAILPLGVWILYAVLSKKNEGSSWLRYRRFAWLGFLANYLFLTISLINPIIHSAIYPKDDLSTYISDAGEAKLLITHPSGNEKKLDFTSLNKQIRNAKNEPIYSDLWYNEVFESGEEETMIDERFPYQLTGAKPKWGSGLQTVIYIEQDGKGFLISTPQQQLYFRSATSFLKEGE